MYRLRLTICAFSNQKDSKSHSEGFFSASQRESFTNKIPFATLFGIFNEKKYLLWENWRMKGLRMMRKCLFCCMTGGLFHLYDEQRGKLMEKLLIYFTFQYFLSVGYHSFRIFHPYPLLSLTHTVIIYDLKRRMKKYDTFYFISI